MNYFKKSFTVGALPSEEYRNSWERIFARPTTSDEHLPAIGTGSYGGQMLVARGGTSEDSLPAVPVFLAGQRAHGKALFEVVHFVSPTLPQRRQRARTRPSAWSSSQSASIIGPTHSSLWHRMFVGCEFSVASTACSAICRSGARKLQIVSLFHPSMGCVFARSQCSSGRPKASSTVGFFWPQARSRIPRERWSMSWYATGHGSMVTAEQWAHGTLLSKSSRVIWSSLSGSR
mgnify:CR=1 FL=1